VTLMMKPLAAFAPFGAVPYNPISQGPFEADIVACLLGLDPFVFQDLLTLGLEFAIKAGVAKKVFAVLDGLWIGSHNRGYRRL